MQVTLSIVKIYRKDEQEVCMDALYMEICEILGTLIVLVLGMILKP